MSSEFHNRVHRRAKELLPEAARRPDSERDAFLRRTCGGDAMLRAEVDSLLRFVTDVQDGFADSSLRRGRRALLVALEPPTTDSEHALPKSVGSYRILGLLGEGGMGIVYEAEQEQLRRKVALKVLRSGFLSPRLVQRFQYEAEVLARLQHPGIARIYETGAAVVGGAGADGLRQPFFAMELIRGRSLHEHARVAGLSIPQRLDLLSRVCDAVHHAHQQGVIHRDLKPNNVLVDESGQPKILDFGVARAADADRQSRSLCTGSGQLLGTLPYMSPEQVSGDVHALDTRSDVYSLGVLLFELLSGALPYDIADCALPEAARRIRDEQPRRLATVNRSFSGDVDVICSRALEKDKARRYQTAADLAADIRRHLRGAPIEARRDSAAYVLRKNLWRNRWPVAAGGALIALLIAFSVFASVQSQRHRLLAERESKASRAATVAAARAEAIKSFLQQMLVAADPDRHAGRDVRVRDVLDHAAQELAAGALANDPAAQAELRATIAHTYFNLGHYRSAVPHYLWLREHHERELGPANRQTLDVLLRLGQSYIDGAGFDSGWYEKAEEVYSECLDRARHAHQDDYELTLAAMNGLSRAWYKIGRREESLALQEELFQNVESALAGEHALSVDATIELSHRYFRARRVEEAKALGLRALDHARRLFGDESAVTIRAAHWLANVYRGSSDPDRAERLMAETLEHARRGLGPEHPLTNQVTRVLYGSLVDQCKLETAEGLLRQRVGELREIRAMEQHDTLSIVTLLADVLYRQGDLDEAIAVRQEGIDRAIANHGDAQGMIANEMFKLAVWVVESGDRARAIKITYQAIDITERVFGVGHEYVARGWHYVARALTDGDLPAPFGCTRPR